jgi:hypothetical protein
VGQREEVVVAIGLSGAAVGAGQKLGLDGRGGVEGGGELGSVSRVYMADNGCRWRS